ncbi:MAG TPA: hydrogenase maturation nickel metallochaperone HypA [Candidatus Binatia bacterium]|jgi:hydrogenase nickel incorporation protein HypA/HybF|nr:hydrogenase maturation nickel metallochaperone HypA [Candidatus Binatia bacterium]
MHEWGFCEGILEAVQRRAAGRRAKRVKLRVGVLHRLDQAALQQAFSLAASGSEAEDAIVDLVFIPARWRCRVCEGESEAVDIIVVCPSCGGTEVEVSGGDELILESVEYETAS